MDENFSAKDGPVPEPLDPNRHLVEHPDHPGFFYDPGLIYIRTGDPVVDAAHRLMMMEHTYCIPQTVVIGG